MLTDRQTDKKQTHKRTELHQFRKQISYDGDLYPSSLNLIGQSVFQLESGNRNVDRQTNGQKKRTDGITPISKATFENLNSTGKSIFELSPETEMLMDRQTNKWNSTNFESNLAMMVIYLPVKFEFDWKKHF